MRTILRHKRLVRRNCFRAGIYWQGICHDWSKYHPIEFWTGVRYYQEGKRSPNAYEREYVYWIYLSSDYSKGLQGMPMAPRYVVEMFCDRMAASRNYNLENYNDRLPLEYYERGKSRYTMHPETAELLERLLHMLAEEGEDKTFAYIRNELDLKHSRWH